MPKRTILTLEQALALPYATQRFVQLGWRVIRIEAPMEYNANTGDPNRYIGAELGFDDLHSYFIAPNTGKEAITLNLRSAQGQELLKQLIAELHVDVFMCNTLPKRYKQLGIEYGTLRTANPALIWCGISAFGPDYPNRAGYDPALQAELGFTYLTGEASGKPVPCGIPIIDLKAGDEAFTQVLLAMLENREKGKEIHISMAQSAASWLITALPQLNFVQSEDELFKRSGNEHRSFIPSNAYQTADGYVYLAIGNDSQWRKLTELPGFDILAQPRRKTNKGRMLDKERIYGEIEAITRQFTTQEIVQLCLSADLAVAPINSIKEVAAMETLATNTVRTELPDRRVVATVPPACNTRFLEKNDFRLPCAPRHGEHNMRVYREIGLDEQTIHQFIQNQVI